MSEPVSNTYKYKCAVCGEPTDKPIQSAFSHFWLYCPNQWEWVPGNFRTFGFWSGLSINLALLCPLYNTLTTWKYRKCRLTINGMEL